MHSLTCSVNTERIIFFTFQTIFVLTNARFAVLITSLAVSIRNTKARFRKVLKHKIPTFTFQTIRLTMTDFTPRYHAFLASIVLIFYNISIFALKTVPGIALNTVGECLRARVAPVVLGKHTVLTSNCN